MAVRKAKVKVVSVPKTFDGKLSETELLIEQERVKGALGLKKAFDSHAIALENIEKAKTKIETGLSELSEDFNLKAVEMRQEIIKIEANKLEATEDYEKTVEELKLKVAKDEQEAQEALQNNASVYSKKIEEASYKYSTELRKEGETAFKRFLGDRELRVISENEFSILSNYKSKDEATVKVMIEESIKSAGDEVSKHFLGEMELEALKNENKIALLEQQIASHDALVGKLNGMISHNQKKDAALLSEVKAIVEAASRGVENNYNHNAQGK